ncbi:MAG: ParB/RepB/Spo0J family partition protein [Clostridia bacterium]|nr:ParB/RepB/Spo0J family partition protein [Clostridia bacterium]
MASNGINIGLKSYDDLFKDDIGRRTEEIKPTPISELKPFSDQPFKVVDDDNMTELVESIKLSGILSPIIARPHPEGGYEILSGHRRVRACEIAGIKEVPVVVKDLDDDTAIILLVDSNLQREHILPSEKAKAYQMKLEAMKRQGERTDLTSDQFGRKSGIESREILAEQVGESKNQISRYVRLTELVDKLLDMVDNKIIAMNAAVELSYLGSKAQNEVLEVIESEDTAPSIAQAKKMRKEYEKGTLNPDVMIAIMNEEKPEKVKITLGEDKIKRYFPKNYTKKQIEDTIYKLLEEMYRKKQREMER